jgi:plastocyanin
MRVCPSLACLILAACSSSGSSPTPDAAAMADAAAAASVRAVTCPPGDMPTVTTADNNDTSFMPSTTTISAHGIVKFVMSSIHNVAPNPIKPSDPGLMVDYGKSACLEFDRAGTFSFLCATHGFVGTIIVQ